MKTKILLFAVISFLCFFSKLYSQTPEWQWAKNFGGETSDYGHSICIDASRHEFNAGGGGYYDAVNSVAIDASGNIYIAGGIESKSLTLGSVILKKPTKLYNCNFLAKFDANGNALWAISDTIGYINSLVLDASQNIYVAGRLNDRVYIAKYNTNGNKLWSKSPGGDDTKATDAATKIVLDGLGNIYVTGLFKSKITFDSTILLNERSTEIFLVKYDNNGNLIWAIRPFFSKKGGLDGLNYLHSIAVDNSGNVLATGVFYSNTIAFGSTILTNNTTGLMNGATIFLAKYDAKGNVIWAKSAGGKKSDFPYSVAVDASENVYIAGSFKSDIINIDSTTLTKGNKNPGHGNAFIAKYDKNGNVLWAKGVEGDLNDKEKSIIVDISVNIFMTGLFSSKNLSFGSTTLTNTKSNVFDAFLAKYDGNGNVLWAKNTGGVSNDVAETISLNASGNPYLYLTGLFYGKSIMLGAITMKNTNCFSTASCNVFLAKCKF